MYNLRYHIASLIAVFLALAVGLLLGTVIAERGMVTDQATALVGDLQRRFDEISAQNKELELGLERDRTFADATVEPLTAGALAGKHVTVVSSTGRVDGTDAVSETIKGAGGVVEVAYLDTPALGLDTAEPQGLAGYFQFRGTEMAKPGQDLERQVAEALAAEWRAGGSELTSLLVNAKLLSAESVPGTSTVDAVVVIGKGEDGVDPFALELAKAMQAAGGIALGADVLAVEGGAPQACVDAGLSGVDNVATAQGKVSLVWILAGRAKGYYGSGQGAQAYFPEL